VRGVEPATVGAALRGGAVSWLGRSEIRLRILLVCDSLGIGGAERHVIGLAAGLKRRGHDVTIACSMAGPLGAEVVASGIALRTLGEHLVKRRVSISYTRQLTELVGRGRFDLVHAHMHASAAAAAVACARADVPVVITEHSEAAWRDDRAWRTSRSAYRRADHVIAVSASIGRRLAAVDRVPSRRVTTIRNAIPLSETVSREPDPFQRRFAPGDLIIGLVARLVPEKGVACFLLAAAEVLRELPRVRFVVIGDGPLREQLVASAAALGISARVRFLGARVDGPQLIAELDLLAVPSLNEGTPLVTLEALSAGVPVVASSVGGIPEQVRGFERVALVPPSDVGALARALIDMARIARRRTASTSRGREIVLLPGHEAMVRDTEAIYAKVYEQALRRRPRAFGALAQQWLAR
jgi:glycosyltransferase involved in cell wall biosynthesis